MCFIILISLYLSRHYISFGECAARVYYMPLGVPDSIILPIAGIVLVFISLQYIRTNKAVKYIEASIHTIIIILTLVFGNEILALRTIGWPETYQVQSIEILNTVNILFCQIFKLIHEN